MGLLLKLTHCYSPAISVEKTYTQTGDDSEVITCKVDKIRSGHTKAPVSAFTFTDGTNTWNNGDSVADEATVSVSKYSPVPPSLEILTIVQSFPPSRFNLHIN